MKNNGQAFTLVELIVTISILAVLGTIAFLELQGYGKEARNTKRTTDITKMSNLVLIRSTEGVEPLVLVGGSNENKIDLTNISVGGILATDGVYKAGLPNYIGLGINRENFLDPNGNDYRIGATSTFGGRYEIATKLERDSTFQSYIKGNYFPRKVEESSIESISGKVVTLGIDATNRFKRGDTVKTNNLNQKLQIKHVGPDKITLTLDTEDMTGITSLKLARPETEGLLASKDDNTVIVTHGSEVNFVY